MSQENQIKEEKKGIFHWWWKEVIFPFGSAIFAIVFFLQAFKIPSSSMEDTLLINDFLLGLKFPYGSNLPWSDQRVPGFTDPKQGDILIFKYPGDPLIPDDNPKRYTHLVNLLFLGNWYYDHEAPEGKLPLVHYVEGPREFIKRCVATGGQIVEVRKKILYVNGQAQMPLPGHGKYIRAEQDNMQFRDSYSPIRVPQKGEKFRLDTLKIADLYRLRSLMAQENPGNQFAMELELYIDGKPANNHVFKDLFVPTYQLNRHGDTIQTHIPTFASVKYLAINRATGDSSFSFEFPRQLQAHDDLIQSGYSFQVPFSYFADNARLGHIPNIVPPADAGFRYVSPYGTAEDDHGKIRKLAYKYYDVQDLILLERYVQTQNELRKDRLHKDSVAGISMPVLPEYKIVAKIKENGQEIKEYQVKDQVYFMMGDNRDNSEDSRFWGFVARRSVSAKAFIIYFSYENLPEDQFQFRLLNPISWPMLFAQIRWSRIAKLIHGL